MQETFQISVVLTTYNSSKFLKETLNSLKKQTFQDFELVITDDASTDDSLKICEQWLSENPLFQSRTQIITSDENTGISANINRGIKAARGTWIKDLAGDDVLFSQALQQGLEFIDDFPFVHIFQAKAELFDTDINVHKSLGILSYEKVMDGHAGEQYQVLLKDNQVVAPTVFYKRSLIEEVGYFDETIPNIDDWPMWLKITRKGYKIYFMDAVIVAYRIHDSSISDSKTEHILSGLHRKTRPVYLNYIYPNIPFWKRCLNNLEFHIKEMIFKYFNNRNSLFGRFVSLFVKKRV